MNKLEKNLHLYLNYKDYKTLKLCVYQITKINFNMIIKFRKDALS